VVLSGVAVCPGGIGRDGWAGIGKQGDLREEQKMAVVSEFALGKGFAVAAVAGILTLIAPTVVIGYGNHLPALPDASGAKIWYHTWGVCRGYIPDLPDNGIDALNPVQISTSGIEPERLKAEFGRYQS